MDDENTVAHLRTAGRRLAAERARLGLTQVALCARIGLTREMWGRYERGLAEIKPGYLAKFAAMGADAQFIRTGVPTPATTELAAPLQAALATLHGALAQAPRNDPEREILAAYRAASAAQQAWLLGCVRTLGPVVSRACGATGAEG